MKHLRMTAVVVGILLSAAGSAWGNGAVLELGTTRNTAATVVVAPVGTTVQNGQALLDAIAAIKNRNPPPSAAEPVLLKLEPGTYEVGSNAVEMIPYVDIEGSGVNATRIVGAVPSYFDVSGTVQGASNAELRHLTVESYPPTDVAVAISNDNASPRIVNVRAVAVSQELSYNAFGVYNIYGSAPELVGVTIEASGVGTAAYGVYNYMSDPTLRDCVIQTSATTTTENGGIYNRTSAPTMTRCEILATGAPANIGIKNQAASPTGDIHVYGSKITADTGVYNDVDYTVYIQGSILDAATPTSVASGVTPHFTCSATVNGSFSALPATCD